MYTNQVTIMLINPHNEQTNCQDFKKLFAQTIKGNNLLFQTKQIVVPLTIERAVFNGYLEMSFLTQLLLKSD